MAYVAQNGTKQMVVADGKEGAPYDGIINTSICFSANGQHLAYETFNRSDKSWTVVVDGQESEKYPDVGGLTIRPDGQVEWIAQKGGNFYRISFPLSTASP